MKLLEYNISPCVRAFSTMREGGFSKGAYGEFNANAFCGDQKEAVAANRQILANEIGIPQENFVYTHQVHSTFVREVNAHFVSMPKTERQNLLEGVDALVTNLPGYCLCISTADCIPVIIYDEKNQAIACVHAGWRGTLRRIVEVALEKMVNTYGTQPCDCKAVIGPGISLENFEVGDEVYEAFQGAGFDMETIAMRPQGQFAVTDNILSIRKEKWHINLPLCNTLQLTNMGVPAENIHNSCICTFDDYEHYFSARRLGIKSGRMITGAMIKPL